MLRMILYEYIALFVANDRTLTMISWELPRIFFVFRAYICSIVRCLDLLVGPTNILVNWTESRARFTVHWIVFLELLRDLALWLRKEDVLKLFERWLFHNVISLRAGRINVLPLAERRDRPRASSLILWGILHLLDSGAEIVLRGAYLHWVHAEGIHLLIQRFVRFLSRGRFV